MSVRMGYGIREEESGGEDEGIVSGFRASEFDELVKIFHALK